MYLKIFKVRNLKYFIILSIIFSGCQLKNNEKYIYVNATLDSLEQISDIKEFKGKKVYVDVWGTFCKPCFEAFEKTKESRQEQDTLSIVYISHDKGGEQKIKELIKKYDLRGYHLKMSGKAISKVLMDDLIIFGSEKSGLPLNYYVSENDITKAPPLEEYLKTLENEN